MSKEVFEPSAAWRRMQEKRALTETLWSGTEAMRDAARHGHWMWPGEGEGKMIKAGPIKTATTGSAAQTAGGMVTRYEMRVRESVLEPLWTEGVKGAAAMPFRRPWSLTGWSALILGSYREQDNGQRELVKPGLVHNADMAGRTLYQMLHQGFELAEAHGMDFLLVDMPGEDVPESRRRPYLAGIRASDMLDCVVEHRYGQPRLEVARFVRRSAARNEELKWRPSGEPEMVAKVYYAGALDAPAGSDDAKVHCEIYDEEGILTETIVVEPPRGELREIPVVPIYGGRTAPYEADPPYYDQAEMAASYWRKLSRSDWKVRNIAATVLGMTGVDFDTEKPGGGAGNKDEDAVIWVADPQGTIDYLETTGAAISALHDDLERVKKSIREGTMQATLSRPAGDVTAFEIGVGTVRANARIEADAVFLEGSAQKALEFASILWGLPERGSVAVPHDFGMPQAGIDQAADLYKSGKLTPEGFFPLAKAASWFPDNWDEMAEIARLKEKEVLDRVAKLEAAMASGVPAAERPEEEDATPNPVVPGTPR